MVEVVAILLLTVMNGLLAMSEIALVSARKTRLQQLADEGRHGAKAALKLASEPAQFLSTVQFGISLIAVGTGAYGGATVAASLKPYLLTMFDNPNTAEGLSIGLVVAGTTLLTLIFGELVPKQIALANAETVSCLIARPMQILSRAATPFVKSLNGISRVVLKVVKANIEQPSSITEEELKVMIDHATEAGVVKESEQDMMKGVLSLGDLTAYDLMTPRHEMVVLDSEDDEETNLAKVIESGHTYFPVVQGEASNIIGVTSIKVLMMQHMAKRTLDLKATLAPPLFVPETVPVLKVLEKFKIGKTHMAFVVDEHGGIEGVITVTDVLKAVVGDMPSMGSDAEDPMIVQREDGSWLVDGRTAITELMDVLHIKTLPKKHAGDYTTVGGLVMTRLGRIPKAGDAFRFRGYRFEVVDMDRRRVDKLLIAKMPRKSPTANERRGDAEAHRDG